MASIVGNSLRNIAVAVAQDIGPYQLLALTSTAGSATQVISTSARDTEAPTSRWGGCYLYSHGPSVIREQSRITRNGFTGSTGTFAVAATFSANPAANTTMSLLGTMPWIDQDGLTGLRTCINRMARKLWIRYRYPITSTGPTVVTYDLGALWWASRQRFIRLLEPDPNNSGHVIPSSFGFDIIQNGDIWTLELGSGFPTLDVFYLEVEMPLNGRIYSSGVPAWGNTASPVAGLTLDDDAYLGDWNSVYQCAKYEVMKQLAVQAGGTRKSYWQNEIDKPGGQAAIVSAIKMYQMNDDGEALGEGPSNGPGVWSTGFGDKGMFGGGY